jgi:hypothetical protein
MELKKFTLGNLNKNQIDELGKIGFKEDFDGKFCHWSGSPLIDLVDGLWWPCDYFNNGSPQYGVNGYVCPIEAAKQSMDYFT